MPQNAFNIYMHYQCNQMSRKQHSPAHEWQWATRLETHTHTSLKPRSASSASAVIIADHLFDVAQFGLQVLAPLLLHLVLSALQRQREMSENILHWCRFLWENQDSSHSYPLFVLERVVLVHGVLFQENDRSQQQEQWLKTSSHVNVHYLHIIQCNWPDHST